ncbi:MAG: hypothetical protein RL226_2049 [Bacteroidota bacterium]|jgi:putative oxidoreductase
MKKTPYTDLAALILRVGSGAMMIPHGIAKVDRLTNLADVKFADPVGAGPLATLIFALIAELVCATMVIIGFKTRWAAVPLIITMAVAAFMVHKGDSWGDKEMAVLYMVTYIGVFLLGSGKYSLDQMK